MILWPIFNPYSKKVIIWQELNAITSEVFMTEKWWFDDRIFGSGSKEHDAVSRLSELIVDMADFYFHACMIDARARARHVQPQL